MAENDLKGIVEEAEKEIEEQEKRKEMEMEKEKEKEKEKMETVKKIETETEKEKEKIETETKEIKTEEEKKKEKEQERLYREKVREAFLDAKETILDALNDRSMDIYQYCAFLSTNSYYVAPKSNGMGGVGGDTLRSTTDGGDTLRSMTTGVDGDTIRNATTTTFSGGGADDSPYMDDRNPSYKKRESINRHSLFSTDRLRKSVPRKYRVMKPMYYWAIIKAILVLGLQFIAVIVAMLDLINRYDNKHKEPFCSNQFTFSGAEQSLRKILFAGFCALLAMTVINTMHDLRKSAFYTCLFEYHCLFPDLVDYGWLIAGRSINYLVLIMITWASFLIIFCSDNVLDMVINSAAVSFVLQLDNMVVGKEQREVVKQYLQVYEWEIEKRVDAFINKEEIKRKEWNIVKILFDFAAFFLGTAIVSPAVYMTAFLAFVFVPIFMLVCA